MSKQLDREGIFKARPVSWRVKTFEGKSTVAIAIEFVVLAQLTEAVDEAGQKRHDWQDWSDYLEHRVWGDYWVITKNGAPNEVTVQQLAESLGWGGSLKAVTAGPPPDRVVQITVKADTYNGKTNFKAGWMNPGDYTPTPGGAPKEEVDALEAQFGSLLRAAASGARQPPKPAQPMTRKQQETATTPDDVPF